MWLNGELSFLPTGLKVNAGKSTVMVSSSGGKWPCGVCGKECRQTLLSAQYV